MDLGNMRSYVENGIENLQSTLAWKEAECERSRQILIELVKMSSAEAIARGHLRDSIAEVCQRYISVQSLRDQIELLNHILKNTK